MNCGDESDKCGEVAKPGVDSNSNDTETFGEHWKEDMMMAKRASLSRTLG